MAWTALSHICCLSHDVLLAEVQNLLPGVGGANVKATRLQQVTPSTLSGCGPRLAPHVYATGKHCLVWTLCSVPPLVGALLSMAFTAGAANAVSAQPSPLGVSERSLRVVCMDAPPTIDGRLSEAAWQQAAVLPSLTQAEPNEGATPSKHTVV